MTNDREILLMLLLRARKERKDFLKIDAESGLFIDVVAYTATVEKWKEAKQAALNAKRIICDVCEND